MSFPITCTACHKTFTVSDEIYEKKVAGRVVTIKCKSCGQGIRVDGTKGAGGGETTPAAATPIAASAEPTVALWAVDYPDGQDREFTDAEVFAELERGAINGATLVWREGMAEWLEVRQVPELAGELAKIEAKKQAAAEAAEASARAEAAKAEAAKAEAAKAAEAAAKAAATKAAAAKPAGGKLAPRAPTEPMHQPRAPMPTVTGLGDLPGAGGANKAKAQSVELKPRAQQPSSPVAKPNLLLPGDSSSDDEELTLIARPRFDPALIPEAPKPRAQQPSSPELPRPRAQQPSSPLLTKPRGPLGSAPVVPGPKAAPAPPPPPAPVAAPAPIAAPAPVAAPSVVAPPAPIQSAPLPVAAAFTAPAPAGLPLPPAAAPAPTVDATPPLPASVARVVSRPPQPAPAFPAAPAPVQAFSSGPVLVADHATVEWPEAKRKTPLVVMGVLAAVAIVGGAVVMLGGKDELPPPSPITAAPLPAKPTSPSTPSTHTTTSSNSGADSATGSDPILATPGAGFAELFAAGARKAESKGASVAPTARFDPAATKTPLAQLANEAQACKQSGGPTGKVTVVVTFDPSGKVVSATITDAPFAGTATAGCITSAFKRASIPPFSGLPGTVSKTFSIL